MAEIIDFVPFFSELEAADRFLPGRFHPVCVLGRHLPLSLGDHCF
jgi:hypothetical protein